MARSPGATPVRASLPSFARPTSYGTGRGPSSPTIRDLNGDGRPELVTASYPSNSVSVLLNRGDGSFRRKRDYRTGKGPSSVAVGDVTGDGNPDLITPNGGTNTVSVLVNRGDGTFRAKRDYRAGRGPNLVAIGDLNGDGKLDLTVGNVGGISVLLNEGAGMFRLGPGYATQRPAAVRDLNGDGEPDLVFAGEYDTVVVLIRDGDGTLEARYEYRTGIEPDEVEIGDLNGDARPDLAVATNDESGELEEEGVRLYESTVSVLLNSGDGSFQAQHTRQAGSVYLSIAIGDLNGDGRPDLALANDDGGYTDGGAELDASTLSVLLNRGDGSFRATRVVYRAGATGDANWVATGDLNGDGRGDLVTANIEKHTVSVFLNEAAGLCDVKAVGGMKLPDAKRKLARAHCRVGKVRRAFSDYVYAEKGVVISQKPSFGAVLPKGGEVDLVTSRGARR